MIDERSYYLIDAYLKGELSDKERIDFEILSKDSDFLDELEIQRKLYAINLQDPSRTKFSKTNEGKEALKAIQVAEKKYFQKKRNHRLTSYLSYGIAASILLAIAVYSTTFFDQKDSSLKNYYAEYANWDELPSLEERVDEGNALAKGSKAFKDKNYKEAIAFFSDYLIKNPNNSQVISYLGVSYLEKDNDALAIETFDKLTQTDTVDSSKGYWYIMLIHLKNENRKEVIAILKKISQNEKNYNYFKAKEILKKIRP